MTIATKRAAQLSAVHAMALVRKKEMRNTYTLHSLGGFIIMGNRGDWKIYKDDKLCDEFGSIERAKAWIRKTLKEAKLSEAKRSQQASLKT